MTPQTAEIFLKCARLILSEELNWSKVLNTYPHTSGDKGKRFRQSIDKQLERMLQINDNKTVESELVNPSDIGRILRGKMLNG